MMTLIFATGNRNKLEEVRQILAEKELGEFQLLSIEEAGGWEEPEETGESFIENAVIKAKAARTAVEEKYPGAIAIADDSGLEVDALPDELGVHSARFMGHDTPYEEKNAEILRRLEEKPKEERSARFVCAAAAILPGIPGHEESNAVVVRRGVIEGYIADAPAGENGFGYDPIFFVDDYGKTTAELSAEEKNEISHRGKAFRMLADALKQRYGL